MNLNGAVLATIQGSNSNYFASSTFALPAGQSALTVPNNSYYKSFSQSFVASISNNIISFILSDSSSSNHKYWIKNINLK